MTDTEKLKALAERWEAMKAPPEKMPLKAAKRLGIQEGGMDDWFIPWSPRNSNDFGEGSWNHWRWLAAIILGLVDSKDRPYDEDKELPFDLLDLIARLEAAEAARKSFGPLKNIIADLAQESAWDIGCAHQEGAPVSAKALSECHAWEALSAFIDPEGFAEARSLPAAPEGGA